MAKKDYVAGTGNVFEDLGSPRAAEALVKAELARKIGALVEQQRLIRPFLHSHKIRQRFRPPLRGHGAK